MVHTQGQDSMTKGLQNLSILNKVVPKELVLEIFSFAGGENIIGADHELKSNEARTIKNWKATALGSMIRAEGFNEVASGLNTVETSEVFTGAGLNDLTPAGTYTGIVTATYTVIIDATGTPDTFKWKKNNGSFTTGVAITGSAQTLSDGVTIAFAATTGHTLNDQWVITAISYTSQLDLLIQHFEGVNTEVYGVLEGDLIKKSGSSIAQEDANAFTSGVLCTAVSAGSKLWATNKTDNLKYKTIGNPLATPTGVPSQGYDRISFFKQRLIVEGGVTNRRRMEGSIVGSGNWNNSDAWSKAGDAWSIDLPDDTKGHIVDWPSGDEITGFTKFAAHALYGFPNVGFRTIGKSFGCSAPYSIAKGPEGVFYFSEYPTKGIILWDGVNFINLTENHDFINKVNLSQRIFGIYRNREYLFFYNDSDTADTFPNRLRIYDTRFGRWWQREINPALLDTFGYPTLLTRSANELYVGSSQKDKIYELETTDTSDESNDTQADYKTKDFTSRDFNLSNGSLFGIDNVKMKLIGFYLTYNGTIGTIGINWTADKGRRSGSRVIDITASGDKLNIDFVLNTSLLVSSPGDRTVFKTFKNNAVGTSFNFQITNSGQGNRPEVKKLKIVAIAMEE